MFSRFDTILACDRRTNWQTNVQPIAKTCFSIADARKIYQECSKSTDTPPQGLWFDLINVQITNLNSIADKKHKAYIPVMLVIHQILDIKYAVKLVCPYFK